MKFINLFWALALVPFSWAWGETPTRVVSMAPSITEILYALDLDDRIVGVTRYCDYPPDAQSKRSVGGYLDPNFEAILALRPDLIILLPEHKGLEGRLGELEVEKLQIDNKTLGDILTSIDTIGKRFGVEDRSTKMINTLKDRMETVRAQGQTLGKKPRVLVTVGRNMGSGQIKDAYVAGPGTFYDEMITLAGGVNAYQGTLNFPTIFPEGLIRLNPDVIIDVIPDTLEQGKDETVILKEWQSLFGLSAVEKNRVFLFGEDYTVIPGPRFILLLEDMLKAFQAKI